MKKGEMERGPVLCNECGAAADSKEENIQGTKWRPADRRTGGRADRIETRKEKKKTYLILEWGSVQENGESGMNVDRSAHRSGEARNSSMER